MSYDGSFFYYVRCESASQIKRLVWYLDEDTRPDFEDDVSPEEKPIFDAIELVPFPDELRVLDSENELLVFFDGEGEDPHDAFTRFINAFKVDSAAFLLSSFDEKAYHCLNDGWFEFLYSPIPLEHPDDDEEFNRKLDGDTLEKAQAAYEQGELELLTFIGRLQLNS